MQSFLTVVFVFSLQTDSPLLNSINRKSTTDISVKSSSSDISVEDYKLSKRLHRRNRTSKLDSNQQQCRELHDCHQHCHHRDRRNCHFERPPAVASASSSKRSTLPSISCDGGGGHIQLCWEHLRALERLGAPKEVHIDTPMIQRRKPKKTRKEKELCCKHCSIPTVHRYAEKAKSFDPYQQKSTLRHRCSASPVFSVEPVESQCDLCRRRRRWRIDFGPKRCKCDDDEDSDLEAEEEDNEDDDFSTSRAVSDSSLASSALPGMRDTASIMVSSYEFECQQQSYNAASSFDSSNGGLTPRRCKNKPPTPKFIIEKRGSSSRLQSHMNSYEDKKPEKVAQVCLFRI